MGDLTNHFEKKDEIKRAKSFVNSKTELGMEMDDLSENNRFSVDEAGKKTKGSENSTKKKKSLSGVKNRTGELKSAADNIKVMIPDKKTDQKKSAQTRSNKAQAEAQAEEEKRIIAAQIAEYHRTLETEETRAFDANSIRRIRRTKYNRLSSRDKNKRVDAALTRRENAALILEAEKKIGKNEQKDSVLDKAEFEQKMREFMNLSGIPYKMDKDRDFVRNLVNNYRVCDQAIMMKKWIDDAVEGDYFPQNVDLVQAQAKINGILEMKKYLDVQKELMQNPYYQHMAQEDISYNDEQLENLKNRTSNDTLRNYLSLVQQKKKLTFVRKKGMDSVKKKSLAAGIRQAEILRSRVYKRQIEKIFSDEAMIIKGNQRFRDKDYDRKYTPEVFQAALRGFNMIRVKDLYFKNVRDLAEHFRENTRIFDETREFEHLLFVAVQRGNAPADEDMIKLRAKIKAIKSAEYLVSYIQNRIIKEPERFRNKTYDEFVGECRDEIKRSVSPDETIDVPTLGMNMETYYKSVLKAVQRAHEGRSEEIRTTYGITHPRSEETVKDGQQITVWHLGQIPDNELRQRRTDYQKNAFINDYIAELKTYSEDVYGMRVSSFAAAYAKRRNMKNITSVFDRVIAQYILGMSSEELKTVVDTLEFGNESKKKELWDRIFTETKSADLTKICTNDKNVFMNNLAWSNRMANILMNYSSSKADNGKDQNKERLPGEIDALYHAGCSHALIYKDLNEALKTRWCRSMPLSDWFNMDTDLQYRFNMNLLNNEGEGRDHQVRIDGKTILKNDDERAKYSSAFLNLGTYAPSKKSEFNTERADAGYDNNPYITLYEARKHFKVINDTSKEEVQRLRDFYDKNKGLEGYEYYEAPNEIAQKAGAIEKKFMKIMSFDLTKLNFTSYMDIIASAGKDVKRFKDCSAIAMEIMETEQHSLFQQYRELLGNEELKETCLLNEEQLKEIEARCRVLNSATGFFDGSFEDILNSATLMDSEMSPEEMLHLSEAEINAKKRAADEAHNADASALWTRVLSFTKRLGGFDMGLDLRDFVQTRRFEKGLYGESLEDDIVNILNRKTGILKDSTEGNTILYCDSEEKFLDQYAPAFAELRLSVTEREAKMNNTASRLYTKQTNYKELKRQQDIAANLRIEARRLIPLDLRRKVGEKSLVSLSGLMTRFAKDNKKLVEDYADEKKRSAFLDEQTRRIYEANIEWDVTSDRDFVRRADQFEKFSNMVTSYNALLQENPDYMNDLRNRTIVDYDKFRSKLNAMLAFSDYYRARKLLIMDPYYISHYNEELSANHDDKSTNDQRYTANLIRLVAECARRLNRENLTSRSYAGMEDLLDTLEMKSRRRGYIFGQADLKKAAISYTKRADLEIKTYLDKVLESYNGRQEDDDEDVDPDFRKINENEKSLNDLTKMVADPKSKNDNPFPSELSKYETETVKRHIATVRNQQRIVGIDKFVSALDEPQKELYDKLNNILKQIKAFEFTDPETKEKLYIKSEPVRMICSLAVNYGRDLPIQEILEMADGFTVMQNPRLDMTKKEDLAYAKQRWLQSARKLFYLEYNAVKRFESTYGTLPDQLPAGSFLHSLGNSKELFFSRSYFGQDMTEITDEEGCKIKGESLSLGRYLVKAGLIKEEELSDAHHLCSRFYQNVNAYYNNAISQGFKAFGGEPEDSYQHSYQAHLDQLNGRREYEIRGPKLSYDQERKFWEDALEEGNATLYGCSETVEFKKKALNLYSDEERGEIREKRNRDARLINLYEKASDDRAAVLILQVKSKMDEQGIKADENILRRMIVFHPAMMNNDKPGSISSNDTEGFIRLYTDYTGSGLREGEKAKKRTEAYSKMTQLMSAVMGSQTTKTVIPDNLVEDKKIKDDKEIIHNSRLMRTIVMERQLNVMQSMMKEEVDKSVILQETFNEFRKLQIHMLSNMIIKEMKKSSRYLELKDIGNRIKTVPDFELNEIETILAELFVITNESENILSGGRRELIQKLYGLNIAKTSEIFGMKEEKKEPVDDLFIEAEGQITEASLGLPVLPQYKVKTTLATGYEKQAANNCWCCSGAAIYNKFIQLNDKKLKREDFVDQYQIRAFRPGEDEIKSYEQVRQMVGDDYDKKNYEEEKARMYAFMGEGNEAFGSIIEVADFFMKKRTDFVLNRMRITLPAFNPPEKTDKNGQVQPRKTDADRENDVRRLYNQKVAFVEKVNEVLSTNNPVSLYLAYEEHYITITALNGDIVTYMDSRYKDEKFSTVSDLLKRTNNGTTVELSWFSKLKEPKEMTTENPGLLYDDEKGYSVPPELVYPEEAFNLAHTRGVCIAQNEDLLGQNMEGIGIIKYFPKFGDKKNITKQKQKPEIPVHKEKEPEVIVKEEKKQGQADNGAAAGVIDRAEKRGSLGVLDELFGNKSEENAQYVTQYADFMDRIMERKDFTFDEKGINMIRNMIDVQVKDKAEAEEARKNFDEKLAPDFREVFRLVSEGVVGEDTAKVFLNPDVMTCKMQADNKTTYDTMIYDTFTSRTKPVQQPAEEKYKDEVAKLVNNFTSKGKSVSLQGGTKLGRDLNVLEGKLKKNTFVQFHCDKEIKDKKTENMRCYITVQEDKQKEMVIRLREFIDKNPHFRGAFNFKLMSTQNGKKLDNIVIYYDIKEDAELIKEFISGFGDKIKDIASTNESIPTTETIQPGVAICSEPGETFRQLYRLSKTYNPLCSGDFSMKGNELLQEHAQRMPEDKRKPRLNVSWDTYCSRLLILSSYIARHRLGIKDMDITVSKDDRMKNEIKKVYGEFLTLSGIDPVTLLPAAKENTFSKNKQETGLAG